jgi:hypothetical protein
MKSLLWTYATGESQSVKSQLSDNRSRATGNCRLTIAVIVVKARRHGMPILESWCHARKQEAEILEERSAAQALRNGTPQAHILDACDRKIKALDRALILCGESGENVETKPRFRAALAWAAADLERRLSHVPERELFVWREMLGFCEEGEKDE